MNSIIKASFKEALKKRIFLAVAVITIIYITLFAVICNYFVKSLDEFRSVNPDMVRTLSSYIISMVGFYFSNMLISFLTIMVSVGSVSSELDNGILHAIISRPISRLSYIMGKYTGLLLLLSIFALLLYSVIFVVGYAFGLPVLSTMSPSKILIGFLYFEMIPVALLSAAMYLSVSFKTVVNGIILITIYIAGLIGSLMEQIGSLLGNLTVYNIGVGISLISPFDTLYRKLCATLGVSSMSNAMSSSSGIGGSLSVEPSGIMMAYIAVYICGLFLLAVHKFNKKDLI